VRQWRPKVLGKFLKLLEAFKMVISSQAIYKIIEGSTTILKQLPWNKK